MSKGKKGWLGSHPGGKSCESARNGYTGTLFDYIGRFHKALGPFLKKERAIPPPTEDRPNA
jgi:hypothetical protein